MIADSRLRFCFATAANSACPAASRRAPRRGCTRRAVLLAGVAAATLAGCGTYSAPPKAPLGLEINLKADKLVNANKNGQGTPLLVRIYELKSATAFNEAAFFSLQDHDKKTLGDDLLARDEFVLLPGTAKVIRRDRHPAARALGFFAGYRDLDGAVWRQVYVLPPASDAAWYRALAAKQKLGLTVQFGQKNMVISHPD